MSDAMGDDGAYVHVVTEATTNGNQSIIPTSLPEFKISIPLPDHKQKYRLFMRGPQLTYPIPFPHFSTIDYFFSSDDFLQSLPASFLTPDKSKEDTMHLKMKKKFCLKTGSSLWNVEPSIVGDDGPYCGVLGSFCLYVPGGCRGWATISCCKG